LHVIATQALASHWIAVLVLSAEFVAVARFAAIQVIVVEELETMLALIALTTADIFSAVALSGFLNKLAF